MVKIYFHAAYKTEMRIVVSKKYHYFFIYIKRKLVEIVLNMVVRNIHLSALE